MKRWLRNLLILLAIVIVGGLTLEAGRRYWLPRHGAPLVASRLESIYGGPVRVGDVEVGMNGSSLHDLQLMEAGPDRADTPWATVTDAQADVSAADLLLGQAMPQHLSLTGVALQLRFDRDGHLLTRLPPSKEGAGTFPECHIEQAQITLHQEGRPDMVISGIDFLLKPERGQVVLKGSVADPYWGNWSLNGEADPKERTGSATLKTNQLPLTQAMLNEIPLIPSTTWKEVQAEGVSPVELTFESRPGMEGTHFKVTLDPHDTRVHIPSIDLTAEQAQGKVVIEDDVVHLRDIRGRTADGEIRTSGDLDFHSAPPLLSFHVEADRLDVQQLPKSWSLPGKITGRLSGQADLRIQGGQGKVHTGGTGHGVIQEVRIGGQPAEPIQIDLNGTGDNFRFSQGPVLQPGVEKVRLALAVLATGLLAEQQPPPPAPAKQEKPRFVNINLGMKDADLAQFVKAMDIQLPFPVSGKLSFQVHAAIPMDSPGDMRTYRVDGTATLAKFSLADLQLDQVKAKVTFNEGILRLEELSGQVPSSKPPAAGQVPAGTFAGTARMQLMPSGDLTAQLSVNNIPLARVLSLVPGAAERARGTVSGKLDVKAPTKELKNVAAWNASGSLRTQRIQAYGWSLEEAVAQVQLKQGQFAITDLHGKLEGTPITGSADLGLAAPYPYHAKLEVGRSDLAALERLAPELRPPVAVAGTLVATANAEGTLSPLTLHTSGTAKATNLQLETFRFDSLKFHWENDSDRLALTDLQGELYGGRVTGELKVPLQGAAPGSIDLSLQGIDVGGMGKDIPSMPFRIEGQAEGTIQGKLAPAVQGRDRVFSGKIDLKAPKLKVQEIPAERLHGTVDYRKGIAEYHLEGESLGGSFHLDGQLPPTGSSPAAPPQGGQGRWRIQGVRLAQLWQALGAQAALGPLRGTADLDLPYHHNPSDWMPAGEGTLVIHRLRWGQNELAESLQGQVRLTGEQLRVSNLTATLGEGTLRGQVVFNLKHPDQGRFSLALDRAESSRLLAPWPDLASRIQGPVTINLRGSMGHEWSGGGQVTLERGKVLGVEVTDWQLPLTFALVPAEGNGEVEVLDSSAQASQGRVTGHASFRWGSGSRLEGKLTFTRLNLAPLLHQAGESSQFGTGRITGHLDFAGHEVRSLNDVTGTLNGSLEQTQAQDFPAFQQILPFIAPGLNATTTFQTGTLHARLAGGIIRIQQLTLQGNSLQVFAQGNVSIQERLDLDVTANTGQLGVNPTFLQRLGVQLPIYGPVPIALLQQVSTYLSNRVLHLRVTGTVRAPIIRVEPLTLLSEEAVRYFVNRTNLPIP